MTFMGRPLIFGLIVATTLLMDLQCYRIDRNNDLPGCIFCVTGSIVTITLLVDRLCYGIDRNNDKPLNSMRFAMAPVEIITASAWTIVSRAKK